MQKFHPEGVRIIAGKRGKEIIAAILIAVYFEAYIEKFLYPELQKNEVVVCDIHKKLDSKCKL
ncbi:hypothetical protein [Candidatus Mesenet endosymbiont of Agriotes lineatus]|uniref:hypothetical protein n=1 Tax=Candidatus Mesenet endosymbiont of Agriotes lineatus TaxID=3077948 RepID=UPI0030D26AD5